MLVVNDRNDSHLLQEMLGELYGDGLEITTAHRLDDGLARLAQTSPDVVLLELDLPDGRGPAALQRLRDGAPSVPVIVLTDIEREDNGLTALENGAQDYLVKQRIDRNLLRHTLRHTIEHAHTAQALRDSEERFRVIFEQSAVGMAYIATSGRFLFVNQTLCNILGYTRTELLAISLGALTHPDDRESGQADIDALLAGKHESYAVDKRFIRKDGSTVWANVNLTLASSATGQPQYFLAVIQDITVRKEAELAQAHLAAIVENSYDAIISKTLDGTILSWNAAAERIYGYTAEEVVGQSIALLYPPGYEDEFRHIFAHVRKGEGIARLETKRRHKDGRLLDIALSVSPIRDATSAIVGASTIERDVSMLQWAEAALKESEERLRQLTENVRQALWLRDVQSGKLLYVSSAYAAIMGIPVEQIYNDPFGFVERVHPVDRARVQAALEQHAEGGFDEEYRIIRPDGELRWIHAQTFPIFNALGRVYRVAGVAEDITAYRRLMIAEREQRVLAEAMRDVANALNSTLDMSEVLDRLLDNIAYVIPHDAAEVMLIDQDDGDTVRIARSRGYADRDLQGELEALRFSITTTPNLRHMSDTKAPLIVPDIHDDRAQEYFVPSPVLFWRSYAGVPICVQDEVIGFINLGSVKPNFFTPIHTDWLQGFAEQAAIAIQNAWLHEQAHELAAHQERQRLARDLHDAVTQTLFSATLTAEALIRRWENDPASIGQALSDLHRLTRGALAETRTVLLELRPGALAGIEFPDLIEQLVEAIQSRKRLAIDVQLDRSDDIAPDVKLVLYRITQEALNNIVKHAGASRVAIRLQRRSDAIQLTIRDDGSGFDKTDVKPDSMGLGIMRERATSVGAVLDIDSTLGEGTCVTVRWAGAAASGQV